jgi:plasmid stabilization system protein ParE
VRIIVHPLADQEASSAEARRPGYGERFFAEYSAAIAKIEQLPNAWRRLDDTGTRCFHLNRFPYGIVYRVDGDDIMIVAVAHESRKPGYWRDRR